MLAIPFAELTTTVGKEIGVSDWLEITQARVDQFAEATGDKQWIHVDVERARRELGGTIAHGYLTLALIVMLRRQVLTVSDSSRTVNYGTDRVRFLSPVKVGARVRLRLRVLGALPKSGSVQLKCECTIEIDGGDRPACVAETLTVYHSA